MQNKIIVTKNTEEKKRPSTNLDMHFCGNGKMQQKSISKREHFDFNRYQFGAWIAWLAYC